MYLDCVARTDGTAGREAIAAARQQWSRISNLTRSLCVLVMSCVIIVSSGAIASHARAPPSPPLLPPLPHPWSDTRHLHGTEHASVAYLFTLRDVGAHPLTRTWTRYFDGCPAGSVRLLSHTDASASPKVSSAPNVFSHSTITPSLKVNRFTFSLVKARMSLLRHAMNSTHQLGMQPVWASPSSAPPPSWFLFLSGNCAPLLPCAEVHRYLKHHSPRSFVSADRCDDANRLRNASIQMVEKCRKSFGWIGLHRRAVQRLLLKEKANQPEFLRVGIPDESYWSTLLHTEQLPIMGRALTFMSFDDHGKGHGGGAHPDEFKLNNLASVRRRALSAGHVFARKFESSPAMDAALEPFVDASNKSARASDDILQNAKISGSD